MKITSALLAVAALVLCGCKGEQEARDYALGLIDVLKTYQAELEAKSGGELAAYKKLATIYGQAADTDLLASLKTERSERGDRLADLAAAGKTPTVTAIKDTLKDYAVHDTDATHDLLTRESDNYDKYLSTLNQISVDSDGIAVASKALEVLTRKPTLIQELEFFKTFGASAKSCLDEMICGDLATQLATANASLAAATDPAKKAALTARVTDIKNREQAAGCDKKPACPK